MWQYQAPIRDMQFVIEEWLQAPESWLMLPAFDSLDLPLALQVLQEAGRFSREVLAPLNGSGDREGCRFSDGRVTTPNGFVAAYQAYIDGGWPSLACPEEEGGQGLPQLLNAALLEMIYTANHAWAMYPGIAHGAYECLHAHAPRWIKDKYLPRIISGECLPTMCLTEPQAGSDVGLLRCRALPSSDNSYLISGSKLFISGGEHDLTDEIVHLVLARLPDAPEGSRGVSLFLVPKKIEGQASGVSCVGIEHKMGIKGSATCTLSFERAQGWLIGEPHRGLAAMFVMMNSARLHVGLQGLGHIESAWQNVAEYVRERRQMRAPKRPDGITATGVDPIHFHPTVRRTLWELRAYTEGLRVIGYWAAHLLDVAVHAVEIEKRAEAERLAAILTPIIKAYFTELGFLQSSKALQAFGGYGYINEYGIEQTLRDSRVAMIYEGTNEIQANDLLLRKVLGDGGREFSGLIGLFRQEVQASMSLVECQTYAAKLEELCVKLEKLLTEVLHASAQDAEFAFAAASDFLRLCGIALMAYAWAKTARLSQPKAHADPFYKEKLTTAAFFYTHMWSEVDFRIASVLSAVSPLPFMKS